MRTLVILATMFLAFASSRESAFPEARTRQFIPETIIDEDPQPDKTACQRDRSTDACFHFTMEISRNSADFQEVPLGTPLCEGDLVAFRFSSSEDILIAIDNFGTSGAVNRLYPFEGENMPLMRNRETRYPAESGFGVDGKLGLCGPHPGWEGMVIYRSPFKAFSAGLQGTRRLVTRGLGDGGEQSAEDPAPPTQESPPSDAPSASDTSRKKPPAAPSRQEDLSLSEKTIGVRVRDLHPPAYKQKNGIFDQAAGENALFFKLRHVAAPCPDL